MPNAHNESKPAILRAELKEWERSFAAANGDRKPGREDIKKDPEIGMLFSLGQIRPIQSRLTD